MHTWWRFSLLGGLALVLCFAAAAPAVRADERSELQELRERLERLEKQNAYLLRIIEGGVRPAAEKESDLVEKKEDDKDKLQKLVTEILKEKDDKKKKEEEEKKAAAGPDYTMKAKWNRGLELGTEDKHFKVHVGGRAQFDMAWFQAPQDIQFGPTGTGVIEDGWAFRRVRLRADGTMYDNVEWITEVEFSNAQDAEPLGQSRILGITSFTDVNMTIKDLPAVGNFRIGIFKEPIGFEHLIGSRWLNFMERSPGFDAFFERFNAGFSPGAMIFDTACDERMTWWLGVFKDNANTLGFAVGDGEYVTTGRVTGLPYYECDGARFLHIGAGVSQRSLDDHRVRLRSRPSLRGSPPALTPVLADTKFIGAEGQDLFDVEFALNLGPLLLQSEYYGAVVRDAVFPNTTTGTPRGTLFYHGGYAEALYFLTGEHREYNRKTANYDRIVPNHPFCIIKGDEGWCGGWGAWQLGARCSYLNLCDGGVNGGILHDLTLGLNWFLNPNTKFQWNYFIVRRTDVTDSPNGTVQGVGMRMHYDF